MTEFTAYLRGNNFRPIEAKVIANNLEEGNVLILMREPGNQYDPNAIQVLDPNTEVHLGYVAKEVAVELAPLMDEGRAFACVVESNMMRSIVLSISDEPTDQVTPEEASDFE
jgi:hypothetical protein